MFSPLDDSQVAEWFQRLSAPLKRLPAQERAELYLEVRQHLDALVAANKELGSSPEEAWAFALAQFGDPKKIGERLFLECRENRDGSRHGWSAIGFGIVLQFSGTIMPMLTASHFPNMFQSFTVVDALLAFGLAALVPSAVGWKYPFHAVRAAFYAPLFCLLTFVFPELLLILNSHHAYISLSRVMSETGHSLAVTIITCGIAYLASVTRRGWYQPTLADFKLTLPRRRRQTIR